MRYSGYKRSTHPIKIEVVISDFSLLQCEIVKYTNDVKNYQEKKRKTYKNLLV